MNWKDPVYQAIAIDGRWYDDPDGNSDFYSYKCELPSGQIVDRSARFFSRSAFLGALVDWNKLGNGVYKYFYDAMDNGSYGLPDPNSKAVNPPARENTNEAL